MRLTVPLWLLGAAVAFGMACSSAWAQEAAPAAAGPDRIEQEFLRYNVHPALDKLGRGVVNTLAGWLEVPATIHRRYTPQDTGGSLFGGLAHGLARGVLRTGVGLYETVTFFLPYPERFAPILPPLDYFVDGKRQQLPLE